MGVLDMSSFDLRSTLHDALEDHGCVRIIVTGSRIYKDYAFVQDCMLKVVEAFLESPSFEIVSAGCDGAETLGERWAYANSWRIRRFASQWHQYGRYSVSIRHWEMVQYADFLVAFYDGVSRNTQNMIDAAKLVGLPHAVVRIETNQK